MGREAEIAQVGRDLEKEILNDANEPNMERARDLFGVLAKHKTVPVTILEKTGIGKTLTKCVKTLRRHQRTSEHKPELEALVGMGATLLSRWKEAADGEKAAEKKSKKNQGNKEEDDDDDEAQGLPSSIRAYHERLVKHGKDLYKDPPAPPPGHIDIDDQRCPLPKRNKRTGELTFDYRGEDEDTKRLLRNDFHPNRTPEEILRAGAFGGTYFRPIHSAVTNIRYNAPDVLKDTVEPQWISGLDNKTMLVSSTYRPAVNKYGVKCGGSLGMWESSGWISDSDPYGWFQWYCRFYRGRRSSDDVRQIQRWSKSAGPKGRFRSQLCNKILAARTTPDDARISPVIRQTLLHWGLEITEEILAKHKKRVVS